MTRNLVILPTAVRSLNEQVAFLAERSPAAARRLIDAFESACEVLKDMADAGSPRFIHEPGLEGTRVWSLKGFPEHQIFFRVRESTVEIARVWHAKRDLRRLTPDADQA